MEFIAGVYSRYLPVDILNKTIYLHGFASGTNSSKANFMRDRFQENHLSLIIPDLNQEDFSHLTLTRQIHQVATYFDDVNTPITIIGSSFGGLTAAWLAQKYPQIQRLILLAPAFGFLSLWYKRLPAATLQQWQKSGYMNIYHYGFRENRPIHYSLLSDLEQYPETHLQRPIATLIMHGCKDEVVPIQHSRNYQQVRPWVELVEFNSDHSLTDVLPEICTNIQKFMFGSLEG